MAETNRRSVAAPEYEPMIAALAQNWWAIGIRGVLGILFGLIALFLPGVTILSIILVFAAYAFVDGVFGIVAGFERRANMNAGASLCLRVSSTSPLLRLPSRGRELPWSLSCS
jgi:uncharacterized membrane protein HdeD (DUF308 family)